MVALPVVRRIQPGDGPGVGGRQYEYRNLNGMGKDVPRQTENPWGLLLFETVSCISGWPQTHYVGEASLDSCFSFLSAGSVEVHHHAWQNLLTSNPSTTC